jgi:hypothetical protein
VCNAEGTSIVKIAFGHNALQGTLPASMAVFVDLVLFEVPMNDLHGLLPGLPFQNMPSRTDHSTGCYLFYTGTGGGVCPDCHNGFECPWPVHVVNNCQKENLSDTSHQWVDISASDCKRA